MMTLFAITAGCFGFVAIIFIEERPRFAVCAMAVVLVMLASFFQEVAGVPAAADDRLANEPWRLLSVAPLAENHFLIGVRYVSGSVRAYDLNITDAKARDEFLKAMQGLKKGRALNGKAAHGRAGQITDDSMEFSFADVPDSNPKEPPQ